MKLGQMYLLIYVGGVCLMLGQMIGELGDPRPAYTVDAGLIITGAVILLGLPIVGAAIMDAWNK